VRGEPFAVERATDPMLPRALRVRRRRRESTDVFTLELAADASGFGYAPGQFYMIYVFGVGEVPISISGDPARADVIQHTTRAVGAVTRALGGLRPGELLGVRGPFGSGCGRSTTRPDGTCCSSPAGSGSLRFARHCSR
jgi:NAD(P)H-flavin reductase